MSDFLILEDDKTSTNNDNVNNNSDSKKSVSFIDKLNDFVIAMQTIKTREKVIFYRLLSTMTNA
jgi:hypothetical protein